MQKLIAVVLPLLLTPAAHAQWNGQPFYNDRAVCQYITDVPTAAQRTVINLTAGSHGARIYHWLWHLTRNNWQDLNVTQQALFKQISPQWGEHQPVCEEGSAAGEEFLRMHHQMIDELRARLAQNGLPCITGWTTIPRADDPNWPMPVGASNDSSKDPRMQRVLEVWSATFMDWSWLQRHSLAEVGHLVEFSIHNMLHARWSPVPGIFDNFNPLGENPTTVESLMAPSFYDLPELNYLGNPYSAAVNPIFWKLHGWVDNVVVEWLRANGYTYIADDCSIVPGNCYQWRSRWNGGMNHGQEPIGGSSPGSGHDHGQHRGVSTPLDEALAPLAGQEFFRNPLADQMLSGAGEPIGGAGEDPGDRGLSPEESFWLNIEDPEYFVRNFNAACRPR